MIDCRWQLFCITPDGIQPAPCKKRNRNILKADFCIWDGQGYHTIHFCRFGPWNSKRKIVNIIQAYHFPDEKDFCMFSMRDSEEYKKKCHESFIEFIQEIESPGYADFPCKVYGVERLEGIISEIKEAKIPLAHMLKSTYWVGDEEYPILVESKANYYADLDEMIRAMALTLKGEADI